MQSTAKALNPSPQPISGHPGTSAQSSHQLSRRLGLFDVAMLVMGGIIGSGIFMNPYVVAQQVRTPVLILGAWLLGGVTALIGAFVYAELAARLPRVGGQYAYLREAIHPLVAFLYGWCLLLVIQTGGMAAVAVTFARYFVELTQLPVRDWVVAALALGGLTLINCLGVRAGSTVQNMLMVLKTLAIVALVLCGLFGVEDSRLAVSPVLDRPFDFDLISAFGAAMIPVLFAYGGWQTSGFVAGEMREPEKNLPRGLLLGVSGVVLLYLAVNFVCLHVLGPQELANTKTPASAVMRMILGENGARFIAIGITVSTLGFLSQGMLTAPRVYFAMAEDGVFFGKIAWLHPRTHVPVLAIALQGVLAILIATWGRYEQILNYVVSIDFIFFGLTATCVFALHRRSLNDSPQPKTSIPGHPLSTLFFVAVCWLVVANCILTYPTNTVIGVAILLAGVPVYFLWSRKKQ